MTPIPTPTVRLRRLRKSVATRRLFSESSVTLDRLVMPYFVVPGAHYKQETSTGSALWQLSADEIVTEVAPLVDAGVGGIMLFGVPSTKSDDGSKLPEQLADTLSAVRALKVQFKDLVLFVDVCLCSYTSHGHCGLIHDAHHDVIDNDKSLAVLARMAVHLAEAGVDFVSPSDMMDGRVAAIRHALDDKHLTDTGILSYAIKMASAFYGPFRAAANSAPTFGDRKSYQMPAGNRREARRELLLDVEEGADALLIKPALTNLDLIRDAREACDLPLFAYQVSGERAMLVAAADKGLLDLARATEETLQSIRRAGADVIITYEARERALRRSP